MAKIKKTITAGPLVMQAIYPAPNPRDSRAARQGKMHMSSQAQQRMNRKYAYQKLEMSLAANAVSGDLFVCLTYDNDHLPKTRAEAMANMSKFIRRLKAARPKGYRTKYWYNAEHKHLDDDYWQSGRWHHHLIINACGEDLGTLSQLWGNGIVYLDTLTFDRDHTYEELARYMIKEQPDKLGHRAWSCSKGLDKPDTSRERLGNDEMIEPPEGVTVLEDSGIVSTAYGQFRFIKYMVDAAPAPRPKQRRSRRRQKGCKAKRRS